MTKSNQERKKATHRKRRNEFCRGQESIPSPRRFPNLEGVNSFRTRHIPTFPAPRFQPPYLHILYSKRNTKSHQQNQLSQLYRIIKKNDNPWVVGVPSLMQGPSRYARSCQPAQASQPSPLRRGQARERVCRGHQRRTLGRVTEGVTHSATQAWLFCFLRTSYMTSLLVISGVGRSDSTRDPQKLAELN